MPEASSTLNPALLLTSVFALALVASVLLRLWLSSRQIRHVAQHRAMVPAPFAQSISLAAHQKAADYTIAKSQLGMLELAWSTATLMAWTLLGGLDALNQALLGWLGSGMVQQLALLGGFVLIGGLLDLPFSLYQTFVIEERFGFNKITWRLWLGDLLKSSLLGLLIGLPLASLILWLMGSTGRFWWLWAWSTWMGFSLLMMVVFPTFIAPLFNKFQPLEDETLKARVTALMQRCGFSAKGLFVMDGSRRSAHGNAYFTGFGAAKRVVFFDTLLSKLSPAEVDAVLAHELGHFKHRHILKRLIGANDALALLLFMLVVPVFSFFVSPLMARMSRRHEFEADAYAVAQTDGQALASALLKLYEDNASTLTPDPVFANFYYSHPPASERLVRLGT